MKEDISLLPETMRLARRLQQNELTEYYIYTDLSNRVKDAENRKILAQIGMEERAHHFVWQSYTSAAIELRRGKIFWMKLIARIMGFSFAIKLMESGEVMAGETYERLMEEVPEAKRIMEDEERHEQELIDLLNARNRPFRR